MDYKGNLNAESKQDALRLLEAEVKHEEAEEKIQTRVIKDTDHLLFLLVQDFAPRNVIGAAFRSVIKENQKRKDDNGRVEQQSEDQVPKRRSGARDKCNKEHDNQRSEKEQAVLQRSFIKNRSGQKRFMHFPGTVVA